MKQVLILLISLAWLQLDATPSEDSYAAVTNDWYQGNFSNVYELAQNRLAANSNDLVAAYSGTTGTETIVQGTAGVVDLGIKVLGASDERMHYRSRVVR